MKLTQNKLKQLINEVLEEASDKAPFGPFTGSKPYVRSQRSAKLSSDQTSKLSSLDRDFPEMSRVMDQSLGIDNPGADIKTPMSILKRQQEYRDIVANQSMGYFSENGADPTTKIRTAVGEAYKIGSWSTGNYSGSIFANKTGVYVLENDGVQSYFTPTFKDGRIYPINKDFNEQIFMTMFEGRKR